ncbi:unnamed protein product [Phyllotreta striolata]|uniref:Odorant receptor n=1 Tax=Phyllotreta striolata TaxID=444603 RepID=A0A9P0DFT4_PHYSR|nr:unnamed protein product [Phyllotreta striolata]
MLLRDIFPKNEHFRVTMYSCSILGLWPFVFPKNPLYQKMYFRYSKFIYIFTWLFLSTYVVQLIKLLLDEVIFVEEIMRNVSITAIQSLSLIRAYALKSKRSKNMINEVLSTEKRILGSQNSGVIGIYNEFAKKNNSFITIYMASMVLDTCFFVIYPLCAPPIEIFYPTRNETVTKRMLMLSAWFPFDEQKHYMAAYLFQFSCGPITEFYIILSDALTIGLVIYAIGQFRILNELFANFDKYAIQVQNQLKCSKEEACLTALRECTIMHKKMLSFIDDFNDVMGNIMVLDFLQSSFQLASIVLQVLTTKVTLINFLLGFQFALSMVMRLLIYYWCANEIIVESSRISVSIYNSCWYEQPEVVKKSLLLLMQRCNKPCTLEIGSFGIMSLETFISIMRATYSFITLIYNVNNEK